MASLHFGRQDVIRLRGPKNLVTAERPYAILHELEAAGDGGVASTNVLFLTVSECPLACVFCDLWKNTLDTATPRHAVARQIEWAHRRLPPARWVKLYNSGNFFDPRSIPRAEWSEIAQRLVPYERIIVENHASMCGEGVGRFARLLDGQLEVAIGLETARADVLAATGKQMTRESFAAAAERVRRHGADVRAFIIISPPGIAADEAVETALADVEFARRCGARHVSLIPGRGGNGAMEQLASAGDFSPPTRQQLVELMRRVLPARDVVVTVDLWDWDALEGCSMCAAASLGNLQQSNLSQQPPLPHKCANGCGSGTVAR